MSDDSSERSEKATEQRLKEATKKGQIGRSQDFTAWICIGGAAAMIPVVIHNASNALTELLFITAQAARGVSTQLAVDTLARAIGATGQVLLPLLIVTAFVAAAAAISQGGIRLRPVPMRTEQLNIAAGFKRIFGAQALWEGVKALLKTLAIGGALWFVVAGLVPLLVTSGQNPVSFLLARASQAVVTLLIVAVVVGLLLAAIDIAVVRKRNRKHTHMTKKEAKDEHKKSEGDPLVKSQRRSKQMALSRNRMISAVADSSVVLVNPTHFAVAIVYEPGVSAPKVVAKGGGVVAQKIRERAEAEAVPVVRDIPLTRALFTAVEVGREIPVELYTAVAQVLAFVDQLRRRGSARGTHTMPEAAIRNRGI